MKKKFGVATALGAVVILVGCGADDVAKDVSKDAASATEAVVERGVDEVMDGADKMANKAMDGADKMMDETKNMADDVMDGADKMMKDGDKMVDEAMELPATVVDIAVGSADHTTLVTAVKAAGLVDALSAPGPVTVFAPVNTAFDALPPGTVDTLLKPDSKDALTGILTYHVVPTKAMASDVVTLVTNGGGKATVKTLQGEELTLSLSGEKVIVTDAKGNTATVIAADLAAGNGVVHVIDAVLMPAQ